jgi:uncharacterized protein DUF4262
VVKKMPSRGADIAQDVARFGWAAISIDDSDIPFTYTCGLMTTFRHPELIIFGLESRQRYDILAVMVNELRNGHSFENAKTYMKILKSGAIAVRSVDSSHHTTYLGYAMGHCRHTRNAGGLQALQVFWPDSAGFLPFDSACDAFVSLKQPRFFIPRDSEDQ